MKGPSGKSLYRVERHWKCSRCGKELTTGGQVVVYACPACPPCATGRRLGCRSLNRNVGATHFCSGRAMPKADAASERAQFPAYSYVPGLWPHPHSHRRGHRFGPPYPATHIDDIDNDPTFRLGIDLFDNGYYWEPHEAWEHLWYAAGRRGPMADLLKGLIQLAVAGVKVREGREDGVRGHALRAAELFVSLRDRDCGSLDVADLETRALAIAADPPKPPTSPRQPVEIVFHWKMDTFHR